EAVLVRDGDRVRDPLLRRGGVVRARRPDAAGALSPLDHQFVGALGGAAEGLRQQRGEVVVRKGRCAVPGGLVDAEVRDQEDPGALARGARIPLLLVSRTLVVPCLVLVVGRLVVPGLGVVAGPCIVRRLLAAGLLLRRGGGLLGAAVPGPGLVPRAAGRQAQQRRAGRERHAAAQTTGGRGACVEVSHRGLRPGPPRCGGRAVMDRGAVARVTPCPMLKEGSSPCHEKLVPTVWRSCGGQETCR